MQHAAVFWVIRVKEECERRDVECKRVYLVVSEQFWDYNGQHCLLFKFVFIKLHVMQTEAISVKATE